jgi:hypothetical protein
LSKSGPLSEELSEEIRRRDVPVTFPAISSTCLPEAVNRAMCASVILMKGTHATDGNQGNHALRLRTVRRDTMATNPQSTRNVPASDRIRFGQLTVLVLAACI